MDLISVVLLAARVPITEANRRKLLRALGEAGIDPDRIIPEKVMSVPRFRHDDWCGRLEGGDCNCDVDIDIEYWDRPGERN